MKIKFDLNQIKEIVKKYFIPRLEKYKIFTFQGPLGAGKTTFIKSFLRECGVGDIITSPTFTYVNIYKTNKGRIFNHFDLYRLETLEDFLNSGFDEYFYRENSWSFIEWPEIVKPLLQQNCFQKKVYNIVLNYNKNDLKYRILEFKEE